MLSGISLDTVKMVTVGAGLLKEGVTVKTNDHRLAATRMAIAGSLETLRRWDLGRVIQVSARIAGLMLDGQRLPEFYGPQVILDMLDEAYQVQMATYSAVDRGRLLNQTPRRALLEQNVEGCGDLNESVRLARPRQMPEDIHEDIRHNSSIPEDTRELLAQEQRHWHPFSNSMEDVFQGNSGWRNVLVTLAYHPGATFSFFEEQCGNSGCSSYADGARQNVRTGDVPFALWPRQRTRGVPTHWFVDEETSAPLHPMQWSGTSARAPGSQCSLQPWLQHIALSLERQGRFPPCPCGRSGCRLLALGDDSTDQSQLGRRRRDDTNDHAEEERPQSRRRRMVQVSVTTEDEETSPVPSRRRSGPVNYCESSGDPNEESDSEDDDWAAGDDDLYVL